MLALSLGSVRSIALVFVLSVALALLSATIPWLARRLHDRVLVTALVVGIVVGLAAGLTSAAGDVSLTSVRDLMVLVVAWSGGVLLGRGMPPRFPQFLLLFLCLSVLDVLLAVGGYPQTPQTPHTATTASVLVSTNFLLVLPWGRF